MFPRPYTQPCARRPHRAAGRVGAMETWGRSDKSMFARVRPAVQPREPLRAREFASPHAPPALRAHPAVLLEHDEKHSQAKGTIRGSQTWPKGEREFASFFCGKYDCLEVVFACSQRLLKAGNCAQQITAAVSNKYDLSCDLGLDGEFELAILSHAICLPAHLHPKRCSTEVATRSLHVEVRPQRAAHHAEQIRLPRVQKRPHSGPACFQQ